MHDPLLDISRAANQNPGTKLFHRSKTVRQIHQVAYLNLVMATMDFPERSNEVNKTLTEPHFLTPNEPPHFVLPLSVIECVGVTDCGTASDSTGRRSVCRKLTGKRGRGRHDSRSDLAVTASAFTRS